MESQKFQKIAKIENSLFIGFPLENVFYFLVLKVFQVRTPMELAPWLFEAER